MNTFTQILKSINWVDVAMLVLFIRIVFIGIKTGFVTELFKLFGIISAVFISFHSYSAISAFVIQKTRWSVDWLDFVFYVLLVSLVVIAVMFLRDAFFIIFKFETTHAGLNQWGAGVLSVIRAVFLASLIMYGILLSNVEVLQKMIFTSISHKIALKVAPNTYAFIFNNFVGKILVNQKFNDQVLDVASEHGNKIKRVK